MSVTFQPLILYLTVSFSEHLWNVRKFHKPQKQKQKWSETEKCHYKILFNISSTNGFKNQTVRSCDPDVKNFGIIGSSLKSAKQISTCLKNASCIFSLLWKWQRYLSRNPPTKLYDVINQNTTQLRTHMFGSHIYGSKKLLSPRHEYWEQEINDKCLLSRTSACRSPEVKRQRIIWVCSFKAKG